MVWGYFLVWAFQEFWFGMSSSCSGCRLEASMDRSLHVGGLVVEFVSMQTPTT